eukprot:CAMPEP_0197294358 /NCGR_PEP_ID=MMETSP0890-20130614/32192_1 /TAXON_ID=44058 ORGANISM="Aureoumbra lagunensis, Strain CCMP1510" /NCGR_SAMPLE_ID=MMETSP0890 /ASSEMBLY_ACC=CAM_ASM_000533 /LENGTH=217 /DNA_ID=CAMNT_0042769731 /DNA_START=151 /DNA_END=804 /DNA_ORIENTATION=-
MLREENECIFFDQGCLVIPSPLELEKNLPKYYRTSKFSSFQRQLNNFGYHRTQAQQSLTYGDSPRNVRGVRYHKVSGSPPVMNIDELLFLRPLARPVNKRNNRTTDESSSSGAEGESTISSEIPAFKKKRKLTEGRKSSSVDTHFGEKELERAALCLLALDRHQQQKHNFTQSTSHSHKQQPRQQQQIFSVTTVALSTYHRPSPLTPNMPVFTSQIA